VNNNVNNWTNSNDPININNNSNTINPIPKPIPKKRGRAKKDSSSTKVSKLIDISIVQSNEKLLKQMNSAFKENRSDLTVIYQIENWNSFGPAKQRAREFMMSRMIRKYLNKNFDFDVSTLQLLKWGRENGFGIDLFPLEELGWNEGDEEYEKEEILKLPIKEQNKLKIVSKKEKKQIKKTSSDGKQEPV